MKLQIGSWLKNEHPILNEFWILCLFVGGDKPRHYFENIISLAHY
jgi:hypothetical protein